MEPLTIGTATNITLGVMVDMGVGTMGMSVTGGGTVDSPCSSSMHDGQEGSSSEKKASVTGGSGLAVVVPNIDPGPKGNISSGCIVGTTRGILVVMGLEGKGGVVVLKSKENERGGKVPRLLFELKVKGDEVVAEDSNPFPPFPSKV